MEEVRSTCPLWVALMLTYLLGDVLRIFSGDFETGRHGRHASDSGHVLWQPRYSW